MTLPNYNGIPGYSTYVNKLTISSAKYTNIKEISDHINGALAECAMDTRKKSLSPDPQMYNLLQDSWERTDTFDAICNSVQVVGRVISLIYSFNYYAAGAAHPVHVPKVFNYLLEPVCYLSNLRDCFRDETVLGVIKAEAQQGLIETLYGSQTDSSDVEWIRKGTEDWGCFSNFSFESAGIRFQFSSYQVACYAAGMPTVTVRYEKLIPHFTETLLYALNLYRRSMM